MWLDSFLISDRKKARDSEALSVTMDQMMLSDQVNDREKERERESS